MQFKTCTFTKGQWHITVPRNGFYSTVVTIKHSASNIKIHKPERNTISTDSTLSTHAASVFTAVSAKMAFPWSWTSILSLMQTTAFHSCLPRLPSYFNLIHLKKWKMKLEEGSNKQLSLHLWLLVYDWE